MLSSLRSNVDLLERLRIHRQFCGLKGTIVLGVLLVQMLVWLTMVRELEHLRSFACFMLSLSRDLA